LVKSKKVDRALRLLLAKGVAVEIDDGHPPSVVAISES